MTALPFHRRVFAAATVLFAAVAVRAATLPLDVTILQGAAESVRKASAEESREVMFLVLDHSGSMNETDGRESSRWQALLDSLAATLKSVRVGTEVRVEWIESSWEKDRRGNLVRKRGNLVRKPARRTEPVVLSGPESWKSVWEGVKAAGDPDESNGTPLFETLGMVCNSARALVRKGTRVAVVVFSDGNSNEQDKDERRRQVDKEFMPLFSDNHFKTCLVWINPTDNPSTETLLGAKWNLGYKAPPAIFTSSAEPSAITIENPLSGGTGHGTLSYAFHVPADVWKEMEGKPAQISLVRRTEGGAMETVGAATLGIRRGMQRVALAVPDGKLAVSGLSLRLSNIPSPEGAVVSPPPPVELLLVEPDRLSVSSVAPSNGTVVREGDEIAFSVVATPGASVEWTFGDGQSAKGGKAVHAYRNAGTYDAKVLVRKDGFAPREGLSETRRIEVVRASVAIASFEPPVVGREASFSCKGVGPVTGYAWIVDGGEVAGTDSTKKDSSVLLHTFQASGRHTIQVRADLDRLGSVLSEKKEFMVGAAPFLRVDEPVSGQSFAADAPVSFRAVAEGGVAEVLWRVTDASGAEVKAVPAPVSGGIATAEASFRGAGEYAVRAIDKAGAAESTEVFFSIRPKDVALAVSEPADGARVKTGRDVVLRASAKGIARVAWFVRDDAGAETSLGETQVGADGYAAKAHAFPPEGGTGSRMVLARDPAGAIEADPVRIELFTEGGLKMLEPADYLRVPFGTNVMFRAETTGAATDVRWFVDGEELPARGDTVAFEPARAGAPERLFRVQARASMPGGGSRVTPERTIVGYCPALEPRIDLAKKDWDIGAPVQFKLVSPAGRTGRVVWSFGDGTPDETAGATHSHAFAKAGSYEVSARAICADCGESFAAAPAAVSVHCPALCPVLTIDRRDGDSEDAAFARNRPVLMSLSYEAPGAAARAEDVVWDFGDGLSATNLDAVEHPFVDFGEKTVSVSVRCKACGGIETAKKNILIEKKPPKARFSICRTTSSDKPAGGRVPQGSTIALVSTSTDADGGLRWSLNGEPLPEFDNIPAPEFDCSAVGKQVFSLVALDSAGEESESDTHSVRVYRLWVVLLISFLALGFGGFLWWLYAGNDPRFWTFKTMVSEDDSISAQQATEEFVGIAGRSLGAKWKKLSHSARMTLSELANGQSEHWGQATPRGSKILSISESKEQMDPESKGARGPRYEFVGESAAISMTTYSDNQLVVFKAPSPADETGYTALWLRIDIPKRVSAAHLWVRIAWSVFLLFLVCAGCVLFAF